MYRLRRTNRSTSPNGSYNASNPPLCLPGCLLYLGDCHHIQEQAGCYAGCPAPVRVTIVLLLYILGQGGCHAGAPKAKVTATIYRDREGVVQVLLQPGWLPLNTGTRRVSCRLPCNQGDCPYIQGQGGCHADCPAARVTTTIYRDREGVMQIALQSGWLPLYTGRRVSCRLSCSQGDYHYIQGQEACHAGFPVVRITATIYRDRDCVMQVVLKPRWLPPYTESGRVSCRCSATRVIATIYRGREYVMQVVLQPVWLPPSTGTRRMSCRLALQPRLLPPFTGTRRVSCRLSWSQSDCHHLLGQGVCHAGCPEAMVTATIYMDREDLMQVGRAAKVTATIYRDKEGVMQVVLHYGYYCTTIYRGREGVMQIPCNQGNFCHIQGQGVCHAGCPEFKVLPPYTWTGSVSCRLALQPRSCKPSCSQGDCHHIQGQGECHHLCIQSIWPVTCTRPQMASPLTLCSKSDGHAG